MIGGCVNTHFITTFFKRTSPFHTNAHLIHVTGEYLIIGHDVESNFDMQTQHALKCSGVSSFNYTFILLGLPIVFPTFNVA